MKKTGLDNDTLDLIGKRLIRSSTVSAKEIDPIVSDPELFAGVRVKIKGQNLHSSLRASFGRRYAPVFASVAVIAAAAVTGLLVTDRTPPTTNARKISAPAEMPVEARPVYNPPPLRAGSNPTSGRVFSSEPAAQRTTQKSASVPKPGRRDVDIESDGEFYAISYDGDVRSTGGHIIRVDMPRSSLFALGVNVPLENNDSETVKADLLIGPDGATRAIRVVR